MNGWVTTLQSPICHSVRTGEETRAEWMVDKSQRVSNVCVCVPVCLYPYVCALWASLSPGNVLREALDPTRLCLEASF